jgi:hypothetical protein
VRPRGPWTWRARWRAYVALLAVVAAVAVMALVTGRGGDGDQDLLIQDAPTATPSPVESATHPTATPTAGATSPAPDSPDPAPTATTGTPAPEPVLDAAHLLSAHYVAGTFAQGRTPRQESWDPNNDALLACRAVTEAPAWHVAASSSWSWPAEVVVQESLVSLPTEAAAGKRLADCHSLARKADGTTGVTDAAVDAGDGGHLVRRTHELYAEVVGGARVGTGLVLITWRQSGSVTDMSPAETALRAAVAKVLGQPGPTPVTAPAPHPEAALTGFLRTDTLPGSVGQDTWPQVDGGAILVLWEADSRGDLGIPCQGFELTTSDRPTTRRWLGGQLWSEEHVAVYETLAQAEDRAAAEAGFARCRASYGSPKTLTALGDEAFLVDQSVGVTHQLVLVRSGRHYLAVIGHFTDPVPVARAAIDALQSSGRLS